MVSYKCLSYPGNKAHYLTGNQEFKLVPPLSIACSSHIPLTWIRSTRQYWLWNFCAHRFPRKVTSEWSRQKNKGNEGKAKHKTEFLGIFLVTYRKKKNLVEYQIKNKRIWMFSLLVLLERLICILSCGAVAETSNCHENPRKQRMGKLIYLVPQKKKKRVTIPFSFTNSCLL